MTSFHPTVSVLTLSGSDPSGGAGLEADLKVFHRHGVSGMAIATLLTAQNSREVRKVRFLDPDFVAEQWRAIFDVTRPRAIKIGALGSHAMVLRMAKLLSGAEARGIPVVLDPVMGATSGALLLEKSAVPEMAGKLFPFCRLITPNAREFSILTGNAVTAGNADRLLESYAAGRKFAVLLKGGHFREPKSADRLWDGRLMRLEGKRLPRAVHGTGCALASSIAANLALGFSVPAACRRAKAYVAKALASALRRQQKELDFWVKP